MNWFSYDLNGNGFETHETEALARKAAEDALDAERDNAPEGWDEHAVTQICWGRVIGQVVETERRPIEDEDAVSKSCDEFVDYALVEDSSPAVPAPTPPVLRAGQQGSGSGDYPPPRGSLTDKRTDNSSVSSEKPE